MPVLKAKDMPGSVRKKYEIILSGYESIDHKEIGCLWGGKLPIMAVIIEWQALIFDIKKIFCIVINGRFLAIIGRVSLFFCRMCAVGVQDWQQSFPGASGWLPRLLPGNFSRNSLWLF